MRRAGALILLVAACLAATSPSAAQGPGLPSGYTSGRFDQTIGTRCSTVGGSPLQVQGNLVGFAQSSARRRPKVGQTFYGLISLAATGLTCGGLPSLLEIHPPRGVRVAVTKRNPIYVAYREIGSRTPAEGWPERSDGEDDLITSDRARDGSVLFAVATRDGKGDLFPLADGRQVEIHVPLVASRVLRGAPTRQRCRAKGSGNAVCSPRRAGDWLQVSARIGAAVAPTLLVSDVPLFTRRR